MYFVMFPTEAEAGPFIDGLGVYEDVLIAGRRAFKGVHSGSDLTVIICGIGQANAAQAAAAVLETGRPGLLVLAGCAGAYHGSGLSVGDVAVATEEVYADTGVETPSGFMTLEQAGLAMLEAGGRKYYGGFPIPAAGRLDKSIFGGAGFNVLYGAFLTVATVSGSLARANALSGQYRALCENMEGAAAAQVALFYGAQFLEIRGISNMVEDRNRDAWDIPLASRNCATALSKVLESWKA